MMKRCSRQRHQIGMPKGMLRHLTLKILEKHPISGSELMDQIQRFTDWRPSPGSIYPLLAQLEEEKLIEPHHDDEPSLKRFKITERGLFLLKEHDNYDEPITKRHRTMHKMYWILHREMPEDVYQNFLTLLNAIEEIYEKTAKSSTAFERFNEILGDASRKIREIGEW